MKNATGVDAVMIGRAAMGNPIIFNEIVNKVDRKEQNLEYLKNLEN
jgi:tRNA-dihydrouridine synthase